PPCSFASCFASRQHTAASPKLSTTRQKMSQEAGSFTSSQLVVGDHLKAESFAPYLGGPGPSLEQRIPDSLFCIFVQDVMLARQDDLVVARPSIGIDFEPDRYPPFPALLPGHRGVLGGFIPDHSGQIGFQFSQRRLINIARSIARCCLTTGPARSCARRGRSQRRSCRRLDRSRWRRSGGSRRRFGRGDARRGGGRRGRGQRRLL